MTIKGYAASAPGDELKPLSYEPKPLGPRDVAVRITHCGLSYSDVHLIDNDWGMGEFPLIPGHEIVGEVTAKGAKVHHLAVGSRVGIGWQRSVDADCQLAEEGWDNLSPSAQGTCVHHFGGLADMIHTDASYVFPLPREISSEQAAPLMCAGAAAYAPLIQHHVRPSMRVGVVGVGGVGHLAIQYARSFGCEVTAFSSTPDKKQEALDMGAHYFVNSEDDNAMRDAHITLDFIIATVPKQMHWTTYLEILRPNGKLCFLGYPHELLGITAEHLILQQKTVCGSFTAGRSRIINMLEFSARNHIAPRVEVMPMSQVNEAIAKLRANKARYRIVLTND